jgi:hypothetical protein
MLTALDQTPGPRKDPEKEKEEEGQGRREGRRGGGWSIPNPFSFLFSKDAAEDEEKPPLRLSIQAVDRANHQGKVLLNRYGAVRRPIEIRIARRDDQQFRGNYELVLQSYSIPLSDFVAASGGTLDVSNLWEVRFLFDESVAGTVVLDEVGFSNMDPAFLRVSGAEGG